MGLHFHKCVWISVIWQSTVGNYCLHFQVRTSGIQAWDWTQLSLTIKVNRARHKSTNCSFLLSYSFQSEYIHKRVSTNLSSLLTKAKLSFSKPQLHCLTLLLKTLWWRIQLKTPIMAKKAVAQWVSILSTHHQEGRLKVRLPGRTPETDSVGLGWGPEDLHRSQIP